MSVRNEDVCKNMDGGDNVRVKGAFEILCLRFRGEALCRITSDQGKESPISLPPVHPPDRARDAGAKGMCPLELVAPSRPTASTMVATSHMWLIIFKLI